MCYVSIKAGLDPLTLIIQGFNNYMSPSSECLFFLKICMHFLINDNVDININNVLLQVIICWFSI